MSGPLNNRGATEWRSLHWAPIVSYIIGSIRASAQYWTDVCSILHIAAFEGRTPLWGRQKLPRGGELLIVQDYAEEATMDRQPFVAVVIDKAKLPELIHEMTDP